MLRLYKSLRTAAPALLLAMVLAATAPQLYAQDAPTASDVNCAGFYTHRPIDGSLYLVTSAEGPFQNEFGEGDFIYLSRGRDAMSSVGGQYELIRPIRNVDTREVFTGQRAILRQMGTLYAEIARIEIKALGEHNATAQIVSSCESAMPGDIAIPVPQRPTLSYKNPRTVDPFAAPSNKATGVVAYSKDSDCWMGEGHIVYLNLGKNQGVQPGNYMRVFRTYASTAADVFAQAGSNYPQELGSAARMPKVLKSEAAVMPRKVLGEVLILSVEDESSTGIISFSTQEIGVGDSVEIE